MFNVVKLNTHFTHCRLFLKQFRVFGFIVFDSVKTRTRKYVQMTNCSHKTHAFKTFAKCFVHNTIQIIICQGLYEKTLTNTTNKRYAQTRFLPHSVRGLPPFFLFVKALRCISSLVWKELHVIGRKATLWSPVITYCKSMRLQIKPQPFSVMFAQELTRIFCVNPSPRRIESRYA